MKSTATSSFFFLMLCLGINAPAYCAQDTPGEVLNLEEAAALLKVDKKELESAAQHGSIPARQIHTEWRFSRSALLGWLSSSSTESVKTTPPKEIPRQSVDADTPHEAAKQPEITIGKKAEGLTAADIFTHNETVVLERGQWLLDYEQLYSYSKNQGFVSSMDRRTATSTLGVRYGMTDGLQLGASLPYIISSDREFYVDETVRKTKDEFGRFALQAQKTAVKERPWVPETTLILGGEVPLADTQQYQVSLGTVFLKSFDPLRLFGTVSYLYNFKPDEAEKAADGSELFIRKDSISATVGYSLAVNDDVTIGMDITGQFPLQAYSGEDFFQQKEQSYYMRIRCATALTKSLYIDPSATFNLGGSSDITFGLNFSYSL